MKRFPVPAVLVLATATIVQSASGFSPYELYLMSGMDTHVGLLAELQPGQLPKLAKALAACQEEPVATRLSAAGIEKLAGFTRDIEGSPYVVLYFKYAGGQEYLRAAEAFEDSTEELNWSSMTTPHPRAERYGRRWLQMEWINFIRGVSVQRTPTDVLMMGTTILPDKEFQYRSLHQVTWPGVVDQAVRGNIRHLNIFLVELEDRLVEFLYLEYMGQNAAADDMANKMDPINQRWWKLTDACQKPFSDVKEGNWATLDPVLTEPDAR